MSTTLRADDQDASHVFARALVDGWRQNRESFSYFTCRYRITKGQSVDREHALRGVVNDPDTSIVLWVVDGDKECCSVSAAEEAPHLVRDGDSGPIEAQTDIGIGQISETYLACGDVRMLSNPLMRGGTLYGPEFSREAGGNDTATPFRLGIFGPGGTLTPQLYVEQWIERDGNVVVENGTEGNPDLVRVRRANSDGTSFAYDFDPTQGCLLVRSHVVVPRVIEDVMTNSKECSGDRWFPMRWVRMMHSHPSTPLFVQIIEVEDLDADTPPSPESFEVHFGKDWYINERSDPKSQFALSEPMTITPEDLPNLLARARKTAESRKAYTAAKTLAQQPHRSWLSIVTIAALVVFAVYLLGRRYWRRPTS